jgi:hypothetical protein
VAKNPHSSSGPTNMAGPSAAHLADRTGVSAYMAIFTAYSLPGHSCERTLYKSVLKPKMLKSDLSTTITQTYTNVLTLVVRTTWASCDCQRAFTFMVAEQTQVIFAVF